MAGYATDPSYATKIETISQQIALKSDDKALRTDGLDKTVSERSL